MPLHEGQLLAQRWRVGHVLGVGGMAVVVFAQDVQDGSEVAIKALLPASMRVPAIVARFVRERGILRMMTSPYVPRLLDEGALEDGTPYAVMEYLQGSTLADLFVKWGTLPVQTAADFLIQACAAAAEAHSFGVVHRDFKPENLFVTTGPNGFPVVKVLDFGISKPLLEVAAEGSTEEQGLTRANDVLGSPSYMPPEQLVASRRVDYGADIWSLGVILQEMVAGVRPFDGDTVQSVRIAVMTSSPKLPSAFRTDLPASLDDVVRRCVQKFPESRYPSAEALARDLLPFASSPDRSAAVLELIASYGSPAPVSVRSVPAEKLPLLYGPFPMPLVAEPIVPKARSRKLLRRRALRVLLPVAIAGLLAGCGLGLLLSPFL